MTFLPTPVEPVWKEASKAPARLDTGDVHVWRFRADRLGSLADMENALDDEERARTERITSDIARRHYAASQAALRAILAKYLSVAPRAIVFRRGEHGKPFLASSHDGAYQFNLSHSHDWGVVGVAADRELGIDLERVRERPAAPRLAARFYGSDERRAFESAHPGEKERVFFRLWTRKEGHLKATGSGLSVSLREVDTLAQGTSPWQYHEFSVAPEYVACLVTAGVAPRVTYYSL